MSAGGGWRGRKEDEKCQGCVLKEQSMDAKDGAQRDCVAGKRDVVVGSMRGGREVGSRTHLQI